MSPRAAPLDRTATPSAGDGAYPSPYCQWWAGDRPAGSPREDRHARIGTALAAPRRRTARARGPGPGARGRGNPRDQRDRARQPPRLLRVPQPSFVVNDTDTPVLVHAGPGCRGLFVDVIEPGRAKPVRPGGSVSVR
ncbi:hypothetical protein LT493_39780 [Streptomyces tricolor]|nr:hypothetical protein [Streptomyces tricolor]